LPSRVIYVGTQDRPQLRLFISNGHRAHYVALSYCWGTTADKPPLTTVKANVTAFTKAIHASHLPLTIREAIDMTRNLSIEYIWVDSLCIIQDDESDWRRESKNMGQIFRNALCTIAATSATHCEEGLYLERQVDDENPTTPFTSGNFVRVPCISWNGRFNDVFIGTIPGSDSKNLDFDHEINQSRWNRRGWVVQERILSRRIIHFAKNQLYWECQEALYAESNNEPLPTILRLQSKAAIFERISKEFTVMKRWTLRNHALETIHADLGLLKNKVLSTIGLDTGPAQDAMHRFWERIVDTYNICQLQQEGDKLPAIEGLAREVANLTGQTFCAGLWLEDIARGLYWSAKKDKESFRCLRRQHLSGGTFPLYRTRALLKGSKRLHGVGLVGQGPFRWGTSSPNTTLVDLGCPPEHM